MTEPLRVIPLEYAEPALQDRPVWRKIARWGVMLGWFCCVIAWIIIICNAVESVLVSGPIIFGIGVLTFVAGIQLGFSGVTNMGAAHCGICLLFVGLVNALNWSPAHAYAPFSVMGLIYCVAITLPTIAILRKF